MMVTCPYCQAELDSPVELQVGQHVQCSICGKTFPYGFSRGVKLEDRSSRIELPKGRKVEQSPSQTIKTASRCKSFFIKKRLSNDRIDVESNRKIWVLVLCSLILSVTIVSNCSIEKPNPVPRHYAPKEKVEVRQRIIDEAVRDDEPMVEERVSEGAQEESPSDTPSRRTLLDYSNGRIIGMLGQRFGAAKRSGGVERTQVWPNGKICHSNFYVWELAQRMNCFSGIELGYTRRSNRLYAIQLIAKLSTSRSRAEVNEIVEKVKDWLQEEAGVRFSSCRKNNYGYLIYCDETGRNGDAEVNISLATSSSGDPADPPDRLVLAVVQTSMMFEGLK